MGYDRSQSTPLLQFSLSPYHSVTTVTEDDYYSINEAESSSRNSRTKLTNKHMQQLLYIQYLDVLVIAEDYVCSNTSGVMRIIVIKNEDDEKTFWIIAMMMNLVDMKKSKTIMMTTQLSL